MQGAHHLIAHIPLCSEVEYIEAARETAAWADALRLPHGWRATRRGDLQAAGLDGLRTFEHVDGRRVIGTVARHAMDGVPEGRLWLHVSVSRRKYIPSYADVADVKRVFVGDQRQAVQVFPRADRHVNLHEFCLHLWACLDPAGDGLPDFGKDGTI
jgi:hypothetical protein